MSCNFSHIVTCYVASFGRHHTKKCLKKKGITNRDVQKLFLCKKLAQKRDCFYNTICEIHIIYCIHFNAVHILYIPPVCISAIRSRYFIIRSWAGLEPTVHEELRFFGGLLWFWLRRGVIRFTIPVVTSSVRYIPVRRRLFCIPDGLALQAEECTPCPNMASRAPTVINHLLLMTAAVWKCMHACYRYNRICIYT